MTCWTVLAVGLAVGSLDEVRDPAVLAGLLQRTGEASLTKKPVVGGAEEQFTGGDDAFPYADGVDHGCHGDPGNLAVEQNRGEPVRRERLEVAAQAAGLRVMNNVSGMTVAPEAWPDSGKGQVARRHGTRMVRPGTFAHLLPRTAGAAGSRCPDAGRPPGVPASPAVVRAWARENGYVVGPRGRLPQEVQAAFLTAQAGTA